MLLLAFALLAARVVASENLTGANLLSCQSHLGLPDTEALLISSVIFLCIVTSYTSHFIMTSFCFNGFAVASLCLIQGWVRAISTHWSLSPSH